MSASKQRFVIADEMTRLSKLFRNVADLDRQISELYELRYQVRQAERSARKLPLTKLRRRRNKLSGLDRRETRAIERAEKEARHRSPALEENPAARGNSGGAQVTSQWP